MNYIIKDKVLIIHPPLISKDGIKNEEDITVPLGPLTICTFFNKESKDVKASLLDLNLEIKNSDMKAVENGLFINESILERYNDKLASCDLIGLSSHFSNIHLAIQLANHVKKVNPLCKIVIGGVHAAYVAEEILRSFSSIDAVCCQEGERVFYNYFNYMRERLPFELLKGVKLLKDGKIVFNGPEKHLKSNQIPFPDYSMVNLKNYARNSDVPFWIETGRGCPYNCSFCITSKFWRHESRYLSANRIVKEIQLLKAHGVNYFSFTHDNFTSCKSFVSSFCKRIRKSNLRIKWECYSRVDTLKQEQLEQLKESGCKKIFFGFESITKIGQLVLNKSYSDKKAWSLIKEVIKNKIEVEGTFIIGVPNQEENELIKNVFAALCLKEIGVGNIQLVNLTIFPGSDLEKSKNICIKTIEKEVSYKRLKAFLNPKQSKCDPKRIFSYWYYEDKGISKTQYLVLLYLIEYYPNTLNALMNTDQKLLYSLLDQEWISSNSIVKILSGKLNYNVVEIVCKILQIAANYDCEIKLKSEIESIIAIALSKVHFSMVRVNRLLKFSEFIEIDGNVIRAKVPDTIVDYPSTNPLNKNISKSEITINKEYFEIKMVN